MITGLIAEEDDWDAGLELMADAMGDLPAIEIEPAPEDEIKAEHAFDRGENPYPVSDEAIDEAFTVLLQGVLDDDPQAEEAAQIVLEDVQANIRAGMVEGRPRNPGWIRRKGNDTNMVGLTGNFVSGLRAVVVNG